jgi:hypothetical protein
MRPAGGNAQVLRRWAAAWGIDMSHFDPEAARRAVNRERGRQRRTPLEDVLVEGSTYSRHALKQRLFDEGLKLRACELCGQDENWRGRRISLILDHVNGIATDNRLVNLRIVCPNCNATLDTHCGRNKLRIHDDRDCVRCGKPYRPYGEEQRYCSVTCATQDAIGVPQPERRRVARPPEEQLLAEVEALGFLAVGRRYGVSDNAIRKWMRQYERERHRTGATSRSPAPDTPAQPDLSA